MDSEAGVEKSRKSLEIDKEGKFRGEHGYASSSDSRALSGCI